MGKVFVVFEELPVMNKNEWNVCDGKLKDVATGTEMNYSDKYQKKIRIANMNNYIILTNHKAVKRPDGRRYYVVTINTKYCNDHEFFADLRKTCFNDKVGYAFYNYLMELDTDDFNSLIMPETQTKMDMIADLLNPIEKFLKHEFLLANREIKLKIKQLYTIYEKYCDDNGLRVEIPAEFRAGMTQYGFNFKTIGG
jgi:phage/plasmid-associated DNA primase